MRLSAVLLIPVILLNACGGDDGQTDTDFAPAGDYDTYSGGPPGGTLVVLSDREPDELNPLTFNSNPAFQAVHLMFRALAWRDSTLSNYAPDLAESWELRADSTLVIHLRDDVRWHDGVPVTAEDVVFTIRLQKNPLTASPRQADVASVREVTAVDSFTVEVKLDRPGPYTVNALLEVVPVPKHLLEDVAPEEMRFAPFSRNPVGNGFYRFGGWDAGQNLTLLVNEDMPEGRAALDRVILRFVPDVNAAMTELLAGQGDLLKIPPDQRARVEAAPNVELYSAPRVRPTWIAWNTNREPVNDRRVRRAILMAVDREAIARGLFGDVGEAALSPLPEVLREHSESVEPIPYNPDRARQLLEQAGWRDRDGDGIREKGGESLTLSIDYIATDQARRDVLVAMQDMLKSVGIALELKPFESTAWVNRLRTQDFQGSFWGWGWGPGVVGPNAEMVFHSRSIPPAGANFAGYQNPRVDVLIDSALVTTDTARARMIWRELEQLLIDDAVYAPLYLDPELFGVNARFENVKFRGIEWWEDIPYWYIPLDARLPRDRMRG
ncbi:MAG TPA: ABC transporter substrate-binding protein [Longimicrobiaceae bacterium]|nr:ABC transporter substrate-binding protein [Longimicrobiaceae bacterium]